MAPVYGHKVLWRIRKVEVNYGFADALTFDEFGTPNVRVKLADMNGDRLLDLGGGSGYGAALASELVGEHGSDVHADQCCSVHQISNRCAWCEPAISLHVYSRPFDSCYIYDLATGKRELKPMCCDMYGPLAEAFATAATADGPPAT